MGSDLWLRLHRGQVLACSFYDCFVHDAEAVQNWAAGEMIWMELTDVRVSGFTLLSFDVGIGLETNIGIQIF